VCPGAVHFPRLWRHLDEDVHNWYGNFVLDYYLSFFGDKTALHWRDLYNYGAVFDMMAAALNRVSPIGVYETRHLLNAWWESSD